MNKSGFKWGIFTARLPLLHMRIEWPELLQGLVVSLSTGLALVPLLTSAFGLSFEEAVTLAMLHMMIATSHVILFGDPFAVGWITPALPFVLAVVIGGYEMATERFQMMTALAFDFAVITLFLAVTKLGEKLNAIVPASLKAGIILGAGLSAFKRIFYDDIARFKEMPVSFTFSIITCMVILYLPAFARFKEKSKAAALIASLGLLPAFILAGVFGGLNGEIDFNIESGFLIPPFAALSYKISPFVIGFPPLEFFIAALPLALISYLILFGDMITGVALIRDNQPARPDDPVDIDLNRTHYAVGIRNVIMGLFAPFFPTQGVLWAGAQVLVINRWKEGRAKLESLIGGIAAFYYYGIPLFFLMLPVVTLLRPFMPIALMLTLLLTAVACSKLAIKTVNGLAEYVIMAVIAILLAFFSLWVGLLTGVVLCTLHRAAIQLRVKR